MRHQHDVNWHLRTIRLLHIDIKGEYFTWNKEWKTGQIGCDSEEFRADGALKKVVVDKVKNSEQGWKFV